MRTLSPILFALWQNFFGRGRQKTPACACGPRRYLTDLLGSKAVMPLGPPTVPTQIFDCDCRMVQTDGEGRPAAS